MERDSTDKRIDDLAGRVGRFEVSVDKRFDKVDARFDKIDTHFDRWSKVLGSAVVTIVTAVALKILGVEV